MLIRIYKMMKKHYKAFVNLPEKVKIWQSYVLCIPCDHDCKKLASYIWGAYETFAKTRVTGCCSYIIYDNYWFIINSWYV